jgi:asparagine N-glycosylation enzyme membrane subunit Stt3
MASGIDRRILGIGLLGAVACAVWVRVSGMARVFVGDHVLTHDPDALYHLHRIGQTVESFPRVWVRDAYLNWPGGGPCPWAPGFDWLAAGWVLLWGGGQDPARIAAFFPVVLGVLVVLVATATARFIAPRSRTGDLAVVCTAWLAALLPRGVMASQLGRVDHHVAEALILSLLGLGVLWALAESPKRPRSLRVWLAFEAVAAAVVVLGGWMFNGSILYAALAAGVLVAVRLGRPRTEGGWGLLWGSGFTALAAASIALLHLNMGLVEAHGYALDFRFPSFLQPALHGLLACGCLAAACLVRWGPDGGSVSRRWLARVACLGAACAALVTAVYPLLGREVQAGLVGWLARTDPWLGSIAEFQPLFPSWAVWRLDHWQALYHFNGWIGMLAPLAIPLGLWVAWRDDRRTGVALAGLVLPLVLLTLIQNRFGQVLTPWYAVVAGSAMAWLAGRLVRWTNERFGAEGQAPPVFARQGVALAALLLAVLAPDRVIQQELAWESPRRPTAIEAASLFLRERSVPNDPRGVLAAWYYGHTIRVLGAHPVLTAGFGPWTGVEGFEAAGRFMSGSEAELLALMQARDLRFVVTGMPEPLPGPGVPVVDGEQPFVWQPVSQQVALDRGYFRQRPLSPLIVAGSGMPGIDVPQVSHLRPIFAADWSTRAIGLPIFQLWVYERVEGARVSGRVRPGARVIARNTIHVNGESVPYTAWGVADADGRYEFVIPLPSGVDAPELSTGPAYSVFVDDEAVGSLVVTEAAVLEGRSVSPRVDGAEG